MTLSAYSTAAGVAIALTAHGLLLLQKGNT